MNLTRIRRAAAVLALVGWGVMIPIGVAGADCTNAGDFGAGAGCPPGDNSGSNKTESWPPTAVDWPPQLNDDESESGSKKGGGGGGDETTTPIVMPNGQKASTVSSSNSDSKSTSTSETPIVPVGPVPAGKTTTTSGSTSTTTTPIVAPTG
jgi:hypothetical protein